MRLKPLAMATLFGAAMALPAFAQTTTAPAPAAPTAPAVTAPATPAAPAKPTTMAHPTTASTPTATTPTAATPVNINTATPAQLDKLPGIGKARSKAIIAGRPYKSVDELASKKVIPHSVYDKIKDKVSI